MSTTAEIICVAAEWRTRPEHADTVRGLIRKPLPPCVPMSRATCST